jgi:hypothetical protein
MRIRSFVIAYALVLAILLFADRRPHPATQDRYSHIVDLTVGKNAAQLSPFLEPRSSPPAPSFPEPGPREKFPPNG